MTNSLLRTCAVSTVLLLSACSAVGVAATPDPRQKLEDAQVLFDSKNRPLPAEGLILEAIKIFEQRQDWQWLGHSYREYGDLLKSDAVARLESMYRRDGFRDKTITWENHLDRALEFYRMALESYKRAELPNVQASQYDALTNLYLNMGISSHALGLDADACSYYSQMIDAADKNRALHPSMAPSPTQVERVVSHARAAAHCGETSPNNSLERSRER